MRGSRRFVVAACCFLGGTLGGAGAAEAPLPDGALPTGEIESRRSENVREWRTDDGGRVTRVSVAPQLWQDDDGVWHNYDLRLRKASDGDREIGHIADASVAVPTHQDGSSPITLRDGGNSAELTLVGSQPADAVELGDYTRKYEDILPDTTQRVGVTAVGVKEELVVRSARALRKFEYRLKLSSGLVPVVNDDGDIEVRYGTTTVLTVPRAESFEAANPEERHVADPTSSHGPETRRGRFTSMQLTPGTGPRIGSGPS